MLKKTAIAADSLEGRSRNGALCTKRNADKRSYQLAVRRHRTLATNAFTNELCGALLN